MMRCGFGKKISAEDQAKIDAAWQEAEAEEKPHAHVWTNWLRVRGSKIEFRKCIDCGQREERFYVKI